MHFFIRAQGREEGKDPAEDGLDLPRNVTRTNYTSRVLPGRAYTRIGCARACARVCVWERVYTCARINAHPQTQRQTYAHLGTLSLFAHGKGSSPSRVVIHFYVALARGTATPIPPRQPPPVPSRRTIPPIRYAPTFEIVESLLRNQRDMSSPRPLARPARSTASSRGFLFTVRFAKPSATEEFTTRGRALYPCDPRQHANTRPGE